MKTLFLFFIFLSCRHLAVAQPTGCISAIDSNKVIRIAKKKKIYWTKDWQCTPYLRLDTLACKWIVITGKMDHTTKGDCKDTNGCTVATSATLVINAINGKTLRFEKKKQVYHNYE